MPKSMSRSAMLAALLASTAIFVGRADAGALPGVAVMQPAIESMSSVETVQWYWYGGRQWCFFDDGWNGPGCKYSIGTIFDSRTRSSDA